MEVQFKLTKKNNNVKHLIFKKIWNEISVKYELNDKEERRFDRNL